jgi:3-isopropylmalate/(R)-2-methylmalate dehydratase small subunit
MDYGIRVVISPRFADIFRGNSGKGGLLAAQVTPEDDELLLKWLENHPGDSVTVDLTERRITCGPLSIPFQIDDYTRWRLLEGLDDIALTLRQVDEIAAFVFPGHKDPLARPASTRQNVARIVITTGL